jgi:hypothetical protein
LLHFFDPLEAPLIGDRDEFRKDEVGRMHRERVLQLSFGCLHDALATGGDLHDGREFFITTVSGTFLPYHYHYTPSTSLIGPSNDNTPSRTSWSGRRAASSSGSMSKDSQQEITGW